MDYKNASIIFMERLYVATPLTLVNLKSKLVPIWMDLGKWRVLSLGKELYEFTFSSLEAVRRVRSITFSSLEAVWWIWISHIS